MITINRISWKNFLSTGDSPIEIRLDKHKTTLISGDNGSGKSTIMDALAFGLYGKAFRKINKPQLVNSITNKNMVVEVEFVTNSRKYRVRRGLKPALFEIYQDSNLINQEADARDYQKILEQTILKMTYKTFCQIVVLGNANFTPFMQLPAAQRREIIEDLLDIQVFSTMNTILKTQMNENRDKLIETEQRIKILAASIELKRKHEQEMEKNHAFQITEIQRQIETLQKNIDEKLAHITSSTHKCTELDVSSNHATVKKGLTEARALAHRLEAQKTKLDKEREFYKENKECPSCHQEMSSNTIHSRIKSIEDKEQRLVEKQKLLTEKILQLEERSNKYEKIEAEISEILSRISGYKAEIKANQSHIRQLNDTIEGIQQRQKQVDKGEIKQFEEDLQVALTEKELLLNQKELHNIAILLLKDQGIKAQIIKQYIPLMNKMINQYLEDMEFFCKFEIDDSFNEIIRSRYRDEFSYDSFSQGEQIKIDLALLFTWREIARLRNSASVNLLILDEIMDSSLDSSGTEEFLKIIKQLAERNNIIVISHKHDIISDKFERVIRFNKTKNLSRKMEND